MDGWFFGRFRDEGVRGWRVTLNPLRAGHDKMIRAGRRHDAGAALVRNQRERHAV